MGDDARTPVEEPLWKRIILAVPRGFGSLVRSVAGVGEFDPVYRRDGLCFLLIVLAVFFLSLIHISEPTRRADRSRMPSSA